MQLKQCHSAALKTDSSEELNAQETDDDDSCEKKRTKHHQMCSVDDLPLHWTPSYDSQVHTHIGTHTHIHTVLFLLLLLTPLLSLVDFA